MWRVLPISLFFLPTYYIRFGLGPLRTNVLMVWLGIVVLVWLINISVINGWADLYKIFKKVPRWLLVGVILFQLGGLIGLFYKGFTFEKLAQYIVWFLEPGLLGLAAFWWSEREERLKLYMFWAGLIFVGVAGLWAIIQYLTLFGLPVIYWGNVQEPKRATGFFEHPNGFALFLTPLLAWLLPETLVRRRLPEIVAYTGGVLGLLLSLSRGGWLAFVVAVAIYGWFYGGKGARKAMIVGFAVSVMIVLIQPNLRYRLVLPFMGEKSAVSRFSLWETGWKMVKDSPILGQGLTGFAHRWYEFNTDPGLLHYNFPHQIILNTWLETGLLGLIGLLVILFGIFRRAFRTIKIKYLAIGLFMLTIVIHGLVDIPYFKNDLAALFWLILGLGV